MATGSAKVCYYNPYAFWAGIIAVGIGVFAFFVMIVVYFVTRARSAANKVVVVRVSPEDAYEPSGPTKCFDCEGQPRLQVFPSYGEPKLSIGA